MLQTALCLPSSSTEIFQLTFQLIELLLQYAEWRGKAPGSTSDVFEH